MSFDKYVLAFRLDDPIDVGALKHYPAADVNIAKGDIVVDDGNGYATNASITAFAATFIGVAAADCSNSTGSDGDLDVKVIKPLPSKSFIAPVEDMLVAQTDISEIVDLNSEDGLKVNDTTVVAWGFVIDEIDVSAAAIAANTYGFAKGRFMPQPQ